MWSDRIFHAVAGCQAHQPQAAFRDHLRRSDSVAIIFFGSTGPLARNQNHTLGHCTCGCRERNEARKTSSRTSLGDGIQAIVQRLKPRGQTDRQQTRLMAGLPGQPPSPLLSWISWFALHPPSGTPAANPSARLPVSPSFSIPLVRDGGSGTGRLV